MEARTKPITERAPSSSRVNLWLSGCASSESSGIVTFNKCQCFQRIDRPIFVLSSLLPLISTPPHAINITIRHYSQGVSEYEFALWSSTPSGISKEFGKPFVPMFRMIFRPPWERQQSEIYKARLPISRPRRDRTYLGNRALKLSKLGNLYWVVRNCRTSDSACRRKRYRQIRLEKERLLKAGVSQIKLHLQCRVSTNPQNSNYQQRLASYYAQGSLLDGWPTNPLNNLLRIICIMLNNKMM